MKSKVEVPKEQRDLQFAMATATSLQPATSADLWTRKMVELQYEKGCKLSMLKITTQQGGVPGLLHSDAGIQWISDPPTGRR